MFNTAIFFCGLSKNCINTVEKNLNFINSFKKLSNFENVNFISVDSDSDDGTKEILESFSNKHAYSKHINSDGSDHIIITERSGEIERNRFLSFGYV